MGLVSSSPTREFSEIYTLLSMDRCKSMALPLAPTRTDPDLELGPVWRFLTLGTALGPPLVKVGKVQGTGHAAWRVPLPQKNDRHSLRPTSGPMRFLPGEEPK